MTAEAPYAALSQLVQMVMRLDPAALERAAALAPLRIGVDVVGVDLRLQLAIDVDAISVIPWPVGEVPEIEMAATPVTLMKAVLPDRAEELIRSGELRVRGDAGRLQQLQDWLGGLDPDLEEWLSAYIGDVAAHQAGNAARHLQTWLRSRGREFNADVSEFLTHEMDVVVTDDELRAWIHGVDLLRDDVARLEARVRLLTGQSGNSRP